MPRPLKYANADNLLDNCTIKDDCYLWPQSSTPMPMLSPNSPLAKRFGTTSVMRILFSICRFVPHGPRLVHRCSNPFCVNPFHFSESKAVRARRLQLPNPNGLLPEQEEHRHLIAPPDEELLELRPKNPMHIKMLLDSAVLAGYNAQGMSATRSYKVPEAALPRYADPDTPVLVITPRAAPAATEDEDWELPTPTPAPDMTVPPEEPEALEEPDEDDIFAVIRRRREALANKP